MAAILDNKHIDAIMTSLMDGIITFDRNGVIIMANKAAENLFLVRKDGLQDRTLGACYAYKKREQRDRGCSSCISRCY